MKLSLVKGIQLFAQIPENIDSEWFVGSVNINIDGKDFFIRTILSVKDYKKVITFSEKIKKEQNKCQ